MSLMTRQMTSIRFTQTEIRKINELAAGETEGNFSQMVRKLCDEALNGRVSRGIRYSDNRSTTTHNAYVQAVPGSHDHDTVRWQ